MASYQNARRNISDYYLGVEMPGGYSFNTPETLKKVNLYYNGKFETGEKDSRGLKKFFFNIVRPACDIATKFIDLDTKDILLYSPYADQEWRVWVMQHDLRNFLRDTKFDVLLNQLVSDYPKYGHVFIKKANDGKWHQVKIENTRFDPSSPSLATDVWFYEVKLMTEAEIRAEKWNKEKVKTLLSSKQGIYTIYECYDYEGGEWYRTFKADLWNKKQGGGVIRGTEGKINDGDEYLEGITLFSDEVEELPYRELKFYDLPGRRMGQGYVEYLFDNQVAENEAENLERKGLYHKALKLWQTQDDAVAGKNVLTDAENGDIIKAIAEIKPIQADQTDLAAFQTTRQRWAQNTVQKTFTTDITRGENLPSRTPLGVANLSAQMAVSFFEFQREKLGIFIRDLIINDILPDFKKKKRGRHSVMVMATAAGVSKFIEAVARAQVDKRALEFAEGRGNGFYPIKEELDAEIERIKNELRNRRTLEVDVREAVYDDAKIYVDVNITGEQMDTGARIQTMNVALQLVSANPMLVQDPVLRTTFFKMLELSGVSPVDLNLIQESLPQQPQMQQMMQGGSVSNPKQPQMAQMMQGTQRV